VSDAGNPRAKARRGAHVHKQTPHELRAAARARRYRQILAVTGVVWCAALALDPLPSQRVELASAQSVLGRGQTLAPPALVAPSSPRLPHAVPEDQVAVAWAGPASGASAPVASAGTAFQVAAESCPGLSWKVLGAIAQVETAGGRLSTPSAAGAVGPMQLLPATWMAYRPGPGARVTNLQDAATAAARLLCADGAPGNLRAALWSYNHSPYYVQRVLGVLAAMNRGANRAV
jgi:hypothetical protein